MQRYPDPAIRTHDEAFGPRVIAYLLDRLLQIVVSHVLAGLPIVLTVVAMEVGRSLSITLPNWVGLVIVVLFVVLYAVCWVGAVVVFFGYKLLFELYSGVTPGKQLLGLVVVEENGDDLGARSAIVRNLVILGLEFVPFGPVLLFVNAAIADDHRHVGDHLAETSVLNQA